MESSFEAPKSRYTLRKCIPWHVAPFGNDAVTSLDGELSTNSFGRGRTLFRKKIEGRFCLGKKCPATSSARWRFHDEVLGTGEMVRLSTPFCCDIRLTKRQLVPSMWKVVNATEEFLLVFNFSSARHWIHLWKSRKEEIYHFPPTLLRQNVWGVEFPVFICGWRC